MIEIVIKLLALCALVESLSGTNGVNVGEFISQKLEVVEDASNNVSLREIRLGQPSVISCNNADTDTVKIFKPYRDSVYVLKGTELLTVEVENHVQLRKIVDFQLPLEGVVEMRIGDWEGMLVVVLRFTTNLHVYLTKKEQSALVTLEPVQKIKINSSADRIVLLNSNNELFLITQIVKNNVAELSCYKWETSFFSRKSLDIIDFPSRNNLFGVDEMSNGPLVLSIGYGNTTQVIVFQLEVKTGRLTKLQSLHFKQNYAEHYVSNQRLFLIACSTESFCAVYKWNAGQFRRHFKISSQVLEKIARIEYQQDFVILHNYDNSLQLFATENIVHSRQGLFVKGSNEKSEYAICKSSTNPQSSYFVDFTIKDSILAITSQEISFVENLQQSQSMKPDARNCSRELKSYLKQRISQVQTSHQLALTLAQQEATIQRNLIKTINTKITNLNDSTIKRISMPFAVESSVTSLLDRITSTDILIAHGHIAMKNSQKSESLIRESSEPVQNLNNIRIQNLEQKSSDNLLKDILLKTQQPLIFSEQNKFRNTSAVKVVIDEGIINSIPVKQLLNSTSTKMISGEKFLEQIEMQSIVTALTVNNINLSLLKSAADILPNEYIFKGKVNLRNMHLDILNGVELHSFFKNVYLLMERSHIQGNCLIHDTLSTVSLTTKQFMDTPVSDLLTTSTDQSVKADCSVARFYTSMLTTQLINNERLNQTVALANSINFVEVPTRANSVHVRRNLNFLEQDRVGLTKTVETLRNQIIGTRTSDLAQIYSGNVHVQGSLRMKNIARVTPKTSIMLNDLKVPQRISLTFWTLLARQEILSRNFVVQNAQLSTSNAYTTLLSQQPMKNFLYSSLNNSQGHIRVRFEEAIVEGNIDGFKNNIPSLIFHSARECVPLKGPVTHLKSSVVFQDQQLFIRQLNAEHNSNSSWRSFVQKKSPSVYFKNQLHVRKIETVDFVIDNYLKTVKFNNLKLQHQLNAAIKTDDNVDQTFLKIQTFGCKTLSIKFFEAHLFEDFMKNMMWQLQNSENNLVKSVHLLTTEFKGDALIRTFNEIHNLGRLMDMLALRNDIPLSCGGNIYFAKGITITKNLKSKLVNGFISSHFMEHSFSRFERQKIASECSCEMIKAKSVSAKMFNTIAMNQFVNRKETTLSFNVNLKTFDLFARNLDSAYSLSSVNKLSDSLKHPKCSAMQHIRASKGITAIHKKTSHLERIVKFAVFKVGEPQIVAGKFHSAATRTEIISLFKPDGLFYANSKFISFYEIFVDSLKNETEGAQKIHGISTLLSPVYVKSSLIKELAFYSSRDINNIDVDLLNNTIARPQKKISSVKKLIKLQGKRMILQDGLNLVHQRSFVPIGIRLHNLEVGFLRTFAIHKLSLSHFFENTMQISSIADQEVNWQLGLKSLTLPPDATLSSINSVFVNDAVFSRNDQIQEIMGHKVINGKLTLQGPSTIKVINNIDHTDFLKNTILRSKDFSKGKLMILKANLLSGTSLKSYVNGQRIEMFLTAGSDVRKTQTLLSSLQAMRSTADNTSNTKRSKVKRLLYIDNNKGIQFSRNDSQRAYCRKNGIKVSPLKFNEVAITFNSGVSEYDLSIFRIILTPDTLCRMGENPHPRFEEEKLSLEWFDKAHLETKFNQSIVLPGNLNDVEFVESKNKIVLMIASVMKKEEFSVSVHQLDINCNEWKNTQPDFRFKQLFSSHFIDTWDRQFLAVSSTDETSPSEKYHVTIFMLNQTSNIFSACQHILLGVKVDIMMSISVQSNTFDGKPITFLILTERSSNEIYIHQYSRDSKEFIFHQKLYFESAIVQVVVIDIIDFPHFIVSLHSGQFCLFQFRGIESWKVKQCGQFPKVDVIKSYEYFKRQNLFLMSEKLNAVTALSVYQQGELL